MSRVFDFQIKVYTTKEHEEVGEFFKSLGVYPGLPKEDPLRLETIFDCDYNILKVGKGSVEIDKTELKKLVKRYGR